MCVCVCVCVYESCKACDKSGKACKESSKVPRKYLTTFVLKKDFFVKRFFCSFENSLLRYSESLFQKESPGGMPIFVFLKANVQRLWFYQKL